MEALFDDGRIVDLILGFMAVEAFVLIAYHRRTHQGLDTLDVLLALLPGLCLLLALRASLTAAGWTSIAPWLALALAIHLADLWRRIR